MSLPREKTCGKSPRSIPKRLINVDTLRLESLKSPASYAILSHTWSSEEVKFDEWDSDTRKVDFDKWNEDGRQFGYGKWNEYRHQVDYGKWNEYRRQVDYGKWKEYGRQVDEEKDNRKIGLMKIYGAVLQARKQCYRYLWVDTCCIDQTNSAELSESINSMYTWYEEADVCYVYLSDVGHVASMDSRHLEELRESRYFTRGWTLQEMLAAKKVDFFDRQWSYIGHLRTESFAARVSEITGIDPALLQRQKSLDEFSIPQKLSWAALRQTTRLEDRAYSLLGLLNVNMDLRYGEGDKAFLRLQEEILKQPQGLSVLAWRSTTRERRTSLLAISPDDFTDSSDICYDPSLASGSELWITSIGVKGTVPVVEIQQNGDSTNQAFIVLECHPEGSPEMSLGLLVTSKTPAGDGNVVYSVNAMQNDPADTSFTRLGEISFLEHADVHCQPVTIALHSGLSGRRAVVPAKQQTSAEAPSTTIHQYTEPWRNVDSMHPEEMFYSNGAASSFNAVPIHLQQSQLSMEHTVMQQTMPHHQPRLRSQALGDHSVWRTRHNDNDQDSVDRIHQDVLGSDPGDPSQLNSDLALGNRRNEELDALEMQREESPSPPGPASADKNASKVISIDSSKSHNKVHEWDNTSWNSLNSERNQKIAESSAAAIANAKSAVKAKIGDIQQFARDKGLVPPSVTREELNRFVQDATAFIRWVREAKADLQEQIAALSSEGVVEEEVEEKKSGMTMKMMMATMTITITTKHPPQKNLLPPRLTLSIPCKRIRSSFSELAKCSMSIQRRPLGTPRLRERAVPINYS